MRTRIELLLGALALAMMLAAAKEFTRPEAQAWCPPVAGRVPEPALGTPLAGRDGFISTSMACMATMQDSMRAALMSPVGGPDAVFAAAMSAHHQGAIGMANAELRYGQDPELRRMAQGMIATQRPQIQQMQFARQRLLAAPR